MYHFTCTKQKMPGNGEVHRSQHNHGFSMWNRLHVTPLAPEFRGGIQNFWTFMDSWCDRCSIA